MKIVFVSNFFNHHQKALSDTLFALTGGAYRFIATAPVPSARQALGYGTEQPHYVVAAYAAPQYRAAAKALIDEADVVIAGSAPQALLRDRIRAGKLIFRYSERPLKDGNTLVKYIPRLVKWHLRSPMTKPIYMLCASAYTAPDYARFGLFRNRCYKWGYFPETKRYDDMDALMDGKEPGSILWVARYLQLKHPEHAIAVAARLRAAGYHFNMNFIGQGPMEEAMRKQIEENQLQDCVHLLGAMTPEEVRRHMEKAGIFLFTSNKIEGWGAVMNESMNSGCAVVGCEAIGSVPYLIRPGQNGLTYAPGDVDGLYEQVKYLLDHPQEQRRMGAAAYRTITECWNAEIAAARFIALAERILAGEKRPDLYEDGPGSKDM